MSRNPDACSLSSISSASLGHVTGGMITQCGMRLDTKKWGCITWGHDSFGRYYDSSEGGYAAREPAPGQPAGTWRKR